MKQNNTKNILCVVYKATSELDYLLPIIWKIKKETKNVNVSVFYAVINKKMILRRSRFYSDILTENNVTEYDFSDFTKLPMFFKKIFSFCYQDVSPNRYVVNGNNKYITMFKKFAMRLMLFFARRVEKLIIRHIDIRKIYMYFDPDIIYFPLRDYDFIGKKEFCIQTYNTDTKVILYPHSTYPCSGSYNVIYGEAGLNKGKKIPAFCELWYAFSKELTPNSYPGLRSQSFYSGYPGMDSEWLSYLRERVEKKPYKHKTLNCMFIIRRLVEKDDDYDTSDYIFMDEFESLINNLVKSLLKMEIKIRLIIKPHPQNDYVTIKKLMEKVSYKEWEITYEPIYSTLTEIDFVVAVSSGILFLPAVHGIPVILVNTSVKEKIERWEESRHLFEHMKFYNEDNSTLERRVSDVVEYLSSSQNKNVRDMIKKDVDHFRNNYPDGALHRCIDHVKHILVGK